jgi:tetratricopeptide (TPR) repeat protein
MMAAAARCDNPGISPVIPIAFVTLLVSFCLLIAPSFAQTRQAALDYAAWEAIRSGKLEDASRLFVEAIAVRPADALLRLGAGLAEHLQGREEEARRSLNEALRLDPDLTAASLLLGDITYRQGEIETAIRIYEGALGGAPNDPQLQRKLEGWRKEAALHGSFQQNLSSHFTVLFEGPAEQELAGTALQALESAYWRIGTALLAYPSNIITVILYTEQQFRDITRSPMWAGGVYDGTIRVPTREALKNRPQLEKVLAHEFTHALVRNLAPRGAPTWVNEGLAVMFEKGDLSWAEQLVRNAPSLIPLPELHDGFVRLPEEQVPLAYAESALAVRMLLDRAGALTLAMLLKDLDGTQDFSVVFDHRFSLSYLEFQTLWPQSFRKKEADTASSGSGFRLTKLPMEMREQQRDPLHRLSHAVLQIGS